MSKLSKKLPLILIVFLLANIMFGQSQKVRYIKGNITDKTSAIREASGEEAVWLAKQAIFFALENRQYLENDRDLEGLIVAAIFTFSNDNILTLDDTDKEILISQFIDLFNQFNNSSTIQISIISKVLQLKNSLQINLFVDLLNSYIKEIKPNFDSSVLKSTLNALQIIGTSESFVYIYNLWNNPAFEKYYVEIENTLNSLIPISMNQTLQIINDKNPVQVIKIFNLVQKNQNIQKNSLCEIAENVLNESILLMDVNNNSSKEQTQELIKVQFEAFKILSDNNWTPAAAIAITYFNHAQIEYELKLLSDSEFSIIIESLIKVTPIYAVTPLTGYLEGLNRKREMNSDVSEQVILSVINTLGAIGDKSAFDSLLAVTYLNYPESVLTAARAALSGLRW